MEKNEEGQLRLAAKFQPISRANGAGRKLRVSEGHVQPHSLQEQCAVNLRFALLSAGGGEM